MRAIVPLDPVLAEIFSCHDESEALRGRLAHALRNDQFGFLRESRSDKATLVHRHDQGIFVPVPCKNVARPPEKGLLPIGLRPEDHLRPAGESCASRFLRGQAEPIGSHGQ